MQVRYKLITMPGQCLHRLEQPARPGLSLPVVLGTVVTNTKQCEGGRCQEAVCPVSVSAPFLSLGSWVHPLTPLPGDCSVAEHALSEPR